MSCSYLCCDEPKVKATFGFQILLDNGVVVDARSGTFEHGYVSTSYAIQGRTADKVLIAQSKEHSGATFDRQFYVSASRGKQEIEIYTNDKDHLLKSASRSKADISASDLLSHEPTRDLTQDQGLSHGI